MLAKSRLYPQTANFMNSNRKLIFSYILVDVFASLLVWFGFILIRKYINDIQLTYFLGELLPSRYYFNSMLLFPLYSILIYGVSGFYLNLHKKQKIDLILYTLVSSILIAVTMFFGLRLGDVVISPEYFYFSMLLLAFMLFIVTYTFRRLVFQRMEDNYKAKRWTIPTIIIGDGKNAQKIAGEIEKHGYRYTLKGFVSIFKKANSSSGINILGQFYDIDKIIQEHDIKEIILALDDDASELDLFKIINELYEYDVDIRFTPRLYEILTGSARIGNLGVNPLVSVTELNMPDWQISFKRIFDVISSLIALVFLMPVFAFIAIRIKSDSQGPIFFRQERIGRYGKPFNIIKFRTMYPNSEATRPQLSSAFDERVTPFGRTLRKYRLDELPQFWNVLKGDMSIVGPRPERKYYIDQIVKEAPYYCLLYRIRPGLTSWGPIKIGYADTIDKMVERLNYDIVYIESMSLFNDLKILILTMEILFKGKGM